MNTHLCSNSIGLRVFAFSHARRRAFTLLEILIVAMLISLFSGLAIFGMQYLRETSMRKACMADVRTLGGAVAIFQIDHNVIPKLGFLSYPLVELHKMSRNFYTVSCNDPSLAATDLAGGNPWYLPPDFDAMGYYSNPFSAGSMGAGSVKMLKEWGGPYLPSSRQRAMVRTASSVGYFTRMAMPGNGACGPGFSNTTPSWACDDIKATAVAGKEGQLILDWPADPWGSPFVLYLVHLDSAVNASPWWIASPSQSPNYAAYVVSYGKNRFPGGDSTKAEQAAGADNDPLRLAAAPYRLFLEANDAEKSKYDYVALIPEYNSKTTNTAGTLNLRRLQALHNNYTYTDATGTHIVGWPSLGFTGTYPTGLDPNAWHYLSAHDEVPGILDPGSDDIIYQIP